ncbi:homeobox protein homothorax-like isoform X2 [Malaya genurostris]|uniref:homeobox protein homothorax-like isoform X2 n=1 Tax=Malaya genurostris TaxID=325434 RepID=UPI0026F3924D|nr:homeobox protein homothorax-like isoform X2 [Malaya genurostris]
MQENSVTAVPVSGATVTASGITGNGNQTAGGGGGGSGGHTSSNNTSGPTPVSSPSNSTISEIDQAQFEADKRAVYKHPLFSLLALLLEKCEQATQGYIPSSNSSSPNGSSNGTSEGDSFSRDVQAFVQMLEKEKRPLLTNNSELDGLMIKALQVLRIHLLELEKVQELCRDFCTRYIACLRGKMQSENLLRSDYALEHNNNLSNSNSPINSPEQDLSGSAQGYYQNPDYLSAPDTSEYSNMQGQYNQMLIPPRPTVREHVPNDTHNPNSTTPFMPLTTDLSQPGFSSHHQNIHHQHHPQQNHHQNHHHHPPSQHQVPPSATAPVSHVAIPPQQPPLSDVFADDQLSLSGSSEELDDSEQDTTVGDKPGRSKQSKRGILPKHATSVMRAWLFQHLFHPYPTEDEKRAIAAQTNLTLLQVNNWFINARRRILQPMLEHISDNSGQGPPSPTSSQASSTVDQAAQSTISKRYWTESSQIARQLPIQLATNIENISPANVSQAAGSERFLFSASQTLIPADGYYHLNGQPQQHPQQHYQHLMSSANESRW